MFTEVVFKRPIRPLTYKVPENFLPLKPGVRVLVELGNKNEVGIAYRVSAKPAFSGTGIKPVEKVLDREPVLNDELIAVGEWVSVYYLCTIGESLWTIIPKGIKKREKNVIIYEPQDKDGENIALTEEQELVFSKVKDSLDREKDKHFLLYGITGSGKTEIYLRVIHEALMRGKGAILLVPEISLTPQTVSYFMRRMGNQLAVLHSRLTRSEKINEWHRILTGQKRVVIGARSAIFAPLMDIGIIIVDEEHETSYKSDETPRYNAKSVAFFRARRHKATLLLGSATPSIESFHLAKLNKFTLLQLPKRVLNQKLPSTYVTDLRKVKGEKFITGTLFKAIERRLKHREQVILFLNRRGFSPHIYCENCGYVFRCNSCDITLTYHRKEMRLICHYCGFAIDPPDTCPACKYEKISYSGFGTEKIENIIKDYFPGASIARMDTDTVRRRASMNEILSAFSKKEFDILVGTQIVTKGLHFPEVTLVGVLNADIPLNFPDFRSAERTFNIITQVSGRAGRGEKGGEVIIQTYNPVHYAIQTAKNQDYEGFFAREIKYREALLYPPFCRLIRIVFRGEDSKKVFNHADFALSFIKEKGEKYISLLGPSSCPISRIKNNYRVHIIIKLENIAPMRSVLMELVEVMRKKKGLYMEVDIDPLSML